MGQFRRQIYHENKTLILRKHFSNLLIDFRNLFGLYLMKRIFSKIAATKAPELPNNLVEY